MKNTKRNGLAHPTKAAKILKWVVWAAVGLIAVGIAVFLYWLYTPTQVLEFNKYPIPVRTIREVTQDNGVIILQVDYCKKVSAEGRVRTSFVSKTREIFLPVSKDSQPPKCVNTELPILIPKDLPPDDYHIHFSVDYRINPITNTAEEYDSVNFKVVE